MSDVLSVCDAVGATRPALLGVSEGAPLCILFAATHPSRTAAIILLGGFAREMAAPGHPWGNTPESLEAFLEEIRREWGGPVGLEQRAPSRATDDRFRSNWARYLRLGASPAAVLALCAMNAAIDVRPILQSVRVPTLVLHRTGDRAVPVESGRYLAEHIPGATLVEMPGVDHLPWVGDADRVLGEIEEFLTGVRSVPEEHRMLATVLFTDIVGSTRRAAEIGDSA
jgi:pimeloyl-ACP methyl ester carboxylesterase